MGDKEIIARRAACELKDGYVVNMGIGIPTLIPNYLHPSVSITIQSENGFLGLGHLEGEPIANLVNAGGQPCGIVAGGSYFDSAFSFAMIRGGHIDATVLGALQVDSKGDLANWMVPGKMVPGMGGAMDLVSGSKRVIIAMEHCTKDGKSKIVEECTMPLTCKGKVEMIITEMAVFRINNGLILEELGPNVTLEDVYKHTDAKFRINEETTEQTSELDEGDGYRKISSTGGLI